MREHRRNLLTSNTFQRSRQSPSYTMYLVLSPSITKIPTNPFSRTSSVVSCGYFAINAGIKYEEVVVFDSIQSSTDFTSTFVNLSPLETSILSDWMVTIGPCEMVVNNEKNEVVKQLLVPFPSTFKISRTTSSSTNEVFFEFHQYSPPIPLPKLQQDILLDNNNLLAVAVLACCSVFFLLVAFFYVLRSMPVSSTETTKLKSPQKLYPIADEQSNFVSDYW